MKAVDVLKKAKALLENGGWITGSYIRYGAEGDPCAYCAVGAIRMASCYYGPVQEYFKAYNEAKRILAETIDAREASSGDYESVIVDYNDRQPAADRVLEKFTQAIAHAENV